MDPAERYHRISEIFTAVCDLEGTERTQWLDALCVGCPELRPEIEELLTIHDKQPKASGRKPRIGESPN